MSNIKIRVSSGATDFEKELNKKKNVLDCLFDFNQKRYSSIKKKRN